jgi:ubiquinone/menaquinone biosynthesis C-methylase UbiE
MADLATIKARQQQTWTQGDYLLMSADLVLVSELLCETVDLRAGQTVLDVATGTGNTALAAARRRCDVIGIDYAPSMLTLGQARAAAERLPVTFRDGDAEQLPFPDATFNVVLSTFGVMFAPDQAQAARELLRVCRPGGKIGLASWTPESFPGAFRRVIAQYFGAGITSLQVTQRTITQRYRSAQHCVEHLRSYFGPVVAAFAALDADNQARLMRDMVEDAQRFNRSGTKRSSRRASISKPWRSRADTGYGRRGARHTAA